MTWRTCPSDQPGRGHSRPTISLDMASPAMRLVTGAPEKERTLFVPAFVDDYGMDAYEFRVLARIARRGKCYESETEIARSLGMDNKVVRRTLRVLVSAGVIHCEPRHGMTNVYRVNPVSMWGDIKKARSDVGGQDKRRGRVKQPRVTYTEGFGLGNPRGVRVKQPDKGTPIEGNPIKEPPLPPQGGEPSRDWRPVYDRVQKSWNDMAEECGLPPIRSLSDKRRKMIRKRYDMIRPHGAELYEKIKSSRFLTGDNDRGWRCTFDFVWRNDQNYLRIIEGEFDTNAKAEPPLDLTQPVTAKDKARAIRKYGLSDADFYGKGENWKGEPLHMLEPKQRRRLGIENGVHA